VLWRIGQSTD